MTGRPQRLIEQLKLPDDLRTLDPESLRRVAEEVREEIINTISENGGHLGASLGVVELTIALHAELNTPEDAIIWDVGHQSYAHKLLTGRLDSFSSIRTYGGLSGFPCRSESEYDVYGTGHSSSSVSAAVGMVAGGHPGRVVAVIGDGALTGGIAYEALNHAGHLGIPVLVILNDNTMSIEKNVGAMSAYLSRLRTEPTLYRLRRDMERRLQRLPGVGDKVAAMGEQLKDSIKAALVPGMLFEDLGFTYVGVIDGHDIEELRLSIRRSLAVEKPGAAALPHRQGQGIRTGGEAARTLSRYAAFLGGDGQEPGSRGSHHVHAGFRGSGRRAGSQRRAHRGHHRRDGHGHRAEPPSGSSPRTVLRRRHRGGSCGSLRRRSGGQWQAAHRGHLLDLPAAGLRPSDPTTCACKGCPWCSRSTAPVLWGRTAPTHHGAFDLSFLRIIPGLTVFVPKHEAELQRMLATALTLDGPSVIRYPRSAGMGMRLERPIKPLGRAVGRRGARGRRRTAADGRSGHSLG